MLSQIATDLEEAFYRWELRGRGWFLWDDPVLPEPPFRPYIRTDPPTYKPDQDDGRRPTIASGLINWLHHRLHRKSSGRCGESNDFEEPLPDPWEFEAVPVELRLSLPSDLKVTPELAEQFLLSLSSARHPIGFELIGLPDSIVVQFICDADDLDAVSGQLNGYFPNCRVAQSGDLLHREWQSAGTENIVAEFGLHREFILPLLMPQSFAADPLVGLLAALSDVESGEVAALQVLFHPVRNPWGESLARSVAFNDGSPFLLGERDYIAAAAEKNSSPLYATLLRAAARCDDVDRCRGLVRGIAGALAVFADPSGNNLFPLDNEGYDPHPHEQDFLSRRSRRSGMILNSRELIALVHPPPASVQLAKLRPKTRPSAPAPQLVLNHTCSLGINDHAGSSVTITLSPHQRARHMHVIGASGTGKSTLLLHMIAQDIKRGDGVAVLDPHGDLVDAVLRLVPPERAKDVILIDPSDDEYPIGFNVLSAHSAMEKDLLASDLVAVFHRLATSWGDQMNSVLGNAILAFLESERGGTLVDLRRFLVEPAFRKEFLRTVRDQEVVYYWAKEFPLLTGRPQGPVLTRLDTFLRPKPIRYMVAQRQSRLDFGAIMDEGKILLARLAHGAIGTENSYLLGTLLVSKLHQLALGRQRQREEDRRFFWLYIDEFHQFATPSMAAILSGARKYRLGLVLAHQEMQQLEKVPEVASAIASNAYTRVCFRLSDQDARKLETGFAHFTAADLQNLGTGEAICRMERTELDFNLRTIRPPNVSDAQAERVKEEVIRQTRDRFAVPRSEVEAALARSRGASDDDPLATGTAEVESKVSAPTTVKPGNQEPASQEQSVTTATPADPQAVTTLPESEQSAESVPQTPAASVPIASPPAEPVAQASAGRGGPQHQHLQRLIKQWAEGMGFKATIEGPVLGTRAADVALEKEGLSIACELCVTTGFVHELGNIRKCLDAGFTYVAAISPEGARLASLRTVVEQQLDESELARVRFCTPNTFFAFVQEMPSSAGPAAKTVRGYKVRTKYKQAASDAVAKQQVSAVIAQAMRRLKRME